MAEPKQTKETKAKEAKEAKEVKKKPQEAEHEETLVRIFGHDIAGSRNAYAGLTRIKGVSWSISNLLCKQTGLDKGIKIVDLNKEQIDKIEALLANLEIPAFLKNRQKDIETGESKHLLANELDIKKDFDIKRLKQIKSYKGIRHSFKLPVRGQRTRSHFRKSGIAVGVSKKASKK